MTYNICKKLIVAGKAKADASFVDKLDIFLLSGRITSSEYSELIALLNS